MDVSKTVTKVSKSRIIHTQVFTVLVFFSLFFPAEGWEAGHMLFEESLFLFGVILVAMCLVGRAWNLSYVAGSKDNSLITMGPYSLCRNPLYLSNFLGSVGLGLCTETITITLAIVSAFALYYPKVIRKEEIRLRKLFTK